MTYNLLLSIRITGKTLDPLVERSLVVVAAAGYIDLTEE